MTAAAARRRRGAIRHQCDRGSGPAQPASARQPPGRPTTSPAGRLRPDRPSPTVSPQPPAVVAEARPAWNRSAGSPARAGRQTCRGCWGRSAGPGPGERRTSPRGIQVFEFERRHRGHAGIELHLDPLDLGGRIDRLRRQPTAEFRDRSLPAWAMENVGFAGQFTIVVAGHSLGGQAGRRLGGVTGCSARQARDHPAQTADDRPGHPAEIEIRRGHRATPFGLRTQIACVGRPSSDSIASGRVRQMQRSWPS